MTKLNSGYYTYSLKEGIKFIGINVCLNRYSDSLLVSPSVFHQIVAEYDNKDSDETVITYFNFCDELLHEIHFGWDIKGLEDV